jgi:hypothetical protein
MKAVKARPKKAKPVKAKAKKQPKIKPEPKPKFSAALLIKLMAETLQNTSDGEFNLPSWLIRYTDKNHPKHHLGLHREYYIPVRKDLHFYGSDTDEAMRIYEFQAGVMLSAIFGEGITIKEHKYDIPLCRDCE